PRLALRKRVSELLSADGSAGAQAQGLASRLLHPAADCTMHLPAKVGDYTDFFCGIHHAAAGGRINRPGADPLSPNYKYLPVAYHGRAPSVCASGTAVPRPNGQRLQGAATVPTFGPCEKLDYEYEFGIWIGPGNALGAPVPVAQAHEHIFGFCMLNDWSARDI